MDLLSRIRCRRTRALLSSYIDGEVSAAAARRVEAHAAGCSDCRDEIESLRATVELVRALPELELPRSFELSRLPDEEPRATFGVWAPRLATSVAGLLLVALLAADFAGTLVPYGAFDEEAAEMQMDSPPPPMAQAFEASAPQQPQAAAAPPMAAQGAPGEPGDPEAATPEASEAAPAPPAAPAAAMARQSDDGDATPETVAETPAPAMKAQAEAVAEPSPELETAASREQAQKSSGTPAAPAPTAALDDVVASDVWEPSDEEDGLGVSLRQLQIAAAVCFLALAAVTVWLARRRRRTGV